MQINSGGIDTANVICDALMPAMRIARGTDSSPLTKSGLADSLWSLRCGGEHGAGAAG